MTQAIDPRIEQILSQIEAYQAVAADQYDVPAWQALPVASAPDIAFRPKCSQLEPVWQVSDTAWLWQGEKVYNTPGKQLLSPEFALELQAAGVCVTGSHAVDVPLVPTDEVFTHFQKRVSGARAIAAPPTAEAQNRVTEQPATVAATSPNTVANGPNLLPIVLIFLSIAGAAALASHLIKKRAKRQHTKGIYQQPETQPEIVDSSTEQPVELDYDFQL